MYIALVFHNGSGHGPETDILAISEDFDFLLKTIRNVGQKYGDSRGAYPPDLIHGYSFAAFQYVAIFKPTPNKVYHKKEDGCCIVARKWYDEHMLNPGWEEKWYDEDYRR